jgi:hypothetical protein
MSDDIWKTSNNVVGRTCDFLHEPERDRAGSRGGEESFVPRDGWVSPAPQSNLSPPTPNGCSAAPRTYRVEINLPRTASSSSVQLQFWPLYLSPLALTLTCEMTISWFEYVHSLDIVQLYGRKTRRLKAAYTRCWTWSRTPSVQISSLRIVSLNVALISPC